MTKVNLILLSILLGYALTSLAGDIEDDRIWIDHLLLDYAELNGTNFVVDSKVKGRVNVAGLKLEEMTQRDLMHILIRHDFIATEKDGVVYVLPRFAVEHLGKGIGPIWGT